MECGSCGAPAEAGSGSEGLADAHLLLSTLDPSPAEEASQGLLKRESAAGSGNPGPKRIERARQCEEDVVWTLGLLFHSVCPCVPAGGDRALEGLRL